jgi:hypothetical protein
VRTSEIATPTPTASGTERNGIATRVEPNATFEIALVR